VVLAAAAPNLFGEQFPQNAALGRWGWVVLSLVLTLVLTMLAEMNEFAGGTKHATTRVALTLLIVMYAGGLWSFLLATRMIYPDGRGLLAVISVVVVAKVSDTGAYFTGRSIGKHKLAPVLSPAKTVEGAIGGIISGCAASWATLILVPGILDRSPAQVTWWMACGYGLTIAVAGMFGDLAESLVKRDLGRKDSSNWLPGLGGVLDVVDSVLMAAPVGFLWWASGWLGP
jgi:phosphatidate cytidylyltransferase